MPQANDLSRCLTTLDQDSTLIAVIEMSQSSWLVGGIVPGVNRQPLKKLAAAEGELLRRLHRWRDEATKVGRMINRIAVAYEAGRDGFWLARWLQKQGIEAGACPGEGRGDPPDERRRVTGAPSGEDRPARYRTVEAGFSRLAARRTGSLQHGTDPDTGGGRQTAEPRARGPGR